MIKGQVELEVTTNLSGDIWGMCTALQRTKIRVQNLQCVQESRETHTKIDTDLE